jgi:hypothetical protein
MIATAWLRCSKTGIVVKVHIVVLQMFTWKNVFGKRRSRGLEDAEDMSCIYAVSKFECSSSVQSGFRVHATWVMVTRAPNLAL